MRSCPECKRNYPDEYGFCLEDGSTLSLPLAGENTEILRSDLGKGPAGELPKTELPPTAASPLPTIETFKPRILAEQGKPAGRGRSGAVVAAAMIILCVVGVGGFFGLRALERTGQDSGGNVPNVMSQPASSSSNEVLVPPAAVAQPVVAMGRTEVETVEEPVVAQYKRGYIDRWYVKKGDVFQPCKRAFLASYSNFIDVAQINSPSVETEMNGELAWPDAAIVLSLDVGPRETYFMSQRLALLGKIVHFWIVAKAEPSDAERLPLRAKAFFTEAETNRVFNGVIDAVNKTTGDIRIKLEDAEVFDQQHSGCLNLLPDRTGEVRFTVSNIPVSDR